MGKIKIAAFGFRSIPPTIGSAGADKFAAELYPRLVKFGCELTVYNRIYRNVKNQQKFFSGVKLINLRTVEKSGFDSLFHSLKSTLHIIFFNTAKIVHIHNGGNSIFALLLRLFGKKVFVSQDGVDWKREKWKWYAKFYLYLSSFITAYIPNGVIFDNIFSKELFEKKYKKKFNYIPYGSEIKIEKGDESILHSIGVTKGEYFLFVGRFIPDKGLQYLIPAFEKTITKKKLVLIGGSPNPSPFEILIKNTKDERIVFPGYIYGDDTSILMKNSFAYVQPSDVEGLSPVILTVLGLGVPLICSDIRENLFLVENEAITFKKSSVEDLADKLKYSLENRKKMEELASVAQKRILKDYSWAKITEQHIKIFTH
ncbi:MAG: glycosyltransferase [Ignavibacteria bacterium]|nr:glycosyltransferase [Ignavibacteria bacterium]